MQHYVYLLVFVSINVELLWNNRIMIEKVLSDIGQSVTTPWATFVTQLACSVETASISLYRGSMQDAISYLYVIYSRTTELAANPIYFMFLLSTHFHCGILLIENNCSVNGRFTL